MEKDMKIERLKENNNKKWIIGIIVFILLVSTIALVTSRAKYKVTQKIPLVNGTINYSRSDVNIVALYDASGKSINTIPSGIWGVDQTKSFCTTDGSSDKEHKDNNATIFIKNNKINVSNVTKKNTKCFVYLQSERTVEEVINSLELVKGTPNFKVPTPTPINYVETTNLPAPVGSKTGIYTATDDDGTTYYYRGAVENNYLKFAGFWWRIIRFNGDGSIRIIYDGTQYHVNGEETEDSIAIKNVPFNTSSGLTEYVGYMYTIGNRHGHSVSSNIKTQLDNWYVTNLKSNEKYIDKNAGFCGDRSLAKGEGIGRAQALHPTRTDYSAEYRFSNYYQTNTRNPIFYCPEAEYDLYTTSSSSKGNHALTYSIGLITGDEVTFAGNSSNVPQTNYLWNGQKYWTMTPTHGGSVRTFWDRSFAVDLTSLSYAARPVINLSSNVLLLGNGTQSSPYEVVGLS